MRRGKQRPSGRRRSNILVGVVCGSTAVRQALVRSLRGVGKLEAVDCGASFEDCVDRVRSLSIELVLLALDPGAAGALAASLRIAAPRARSVVLLHSETESIFVRLAAAGVVGFIEKGADLVACTRGLRAVHRHGFYCSPNLTAAALRSKSVHLTAREQPHGALLRGRKLEVAECIASGLSNKEICTRLGIAEGTVKNHVHAVLRALSVEHRWEVADALRSMSAI